jgi:hypothetical protein
MPSWRNGLPPPTGLPRSCSRLTSSTRPNHERVSSNAPYRRTPRPTAVHVSERGAAGACPNPRSSGASPLRPLCPQSPPVSTKANRYWLDVQSVSAGSPIANIGVVGRKDFSMNKESWRFRCR